MGNPEAWDRLWTPHRMAYIKGEGKPVHAQEGDECPFCLEPTVSESTLVVARGEHVFAVLNKYPYNAGHVLICPYRHIAMYPELSVAETIEFSEFTKRAMGVLQRISAPQGFNIGMNQGQVAGAGISAHLHQHVVPRWGGDMNFMPVVGGTKVIPALLTQTRDLMVEAWDDEC